MNLALARGNVGRAGAGLMPIRGHSGVQGGAEMGCYATAFPGGARDQPRRTRPTWRRSGASRCRRRRGSTRREMVEGARRGDIEVLWSSGGNFLDVLPAPDITRTALARTPLRVHQDIVLTHQMLVDPGETVVLLPAATRYEQEGGGTSTTTERRVAFSPELDGPRVGEARSEYAIFLDVARRVDPDRADRDRVRDARRRSARRSRASCPRTRASRRCARPATRSRSAARGLCEGGVFPTADGRARFSVVVPTAIDVPARPLPALDPARQAVQLHGVEGRRPAHRRGARRAAARRRPTRLRIGVGSGDAVLVRSPHGEMRARAHLAPMRRGNVQAFFPEANVLLAPNRRDPISGVPDYNAVVEVVKFA